MLRTDPDPLPRPRAAPEPPGSGFARAVQPIVATAVATGTEGLVAGPVTIDSHGSAMPAYRA
ncbi:MAG TPA: carboxymethylenebutenolidase, partial [Caldimonas sp.]